MDTKKNAQNSNLTAMLHGNLKGCAGLGASNSCSSRRLAGMGASQLVALICSGLLGCSGAGEAGEEGPDGVVGSMASELQLGLYQDSWGFWRDDRWPASEQHYLPYCVKSTGWPDTAFRNLIVASFAGAAAQWNRAADVGFVHLPAHDSNCTTSNPAVKFTVEYDGAGAAMGQLYAFLPSAATPYRKVGVGPQNTGPTANYPAAALHEFGHVLGFCWAGVDGCTQSRNVSPDEDSSIMIHGLGLTANDRRGAQKVYGIPWEDLGGGARGIPAASSWGSGRLDIFVRGSLSPAKLMHLWHDGGQWGWWEDLSAPSSLPTGITGSPNAVGRGWGRIDVFVEGSDRALWRKSYDWYAGGWQPWASEGGNVAGRPGVTSWAADRWDVLVVSGGNLFHKWYNGSSHPYEDWGRPAATRLTGDVSAASWGVNRLDAVVMGQDRKIYHFSYDNGAAYWSVVYPYGDLSSPTITAPSNGRLDLYAITNAGSLCRRTFSNGVWNSWTTLGGFQPTGIGAVNWDSGRIDLFSRHRSSNTVKHAYSVGDEWF